MIYIGIDPGLDGAIAFLHDADMYSPARVTDMPTLDIKRGKRTRREYNDAELATILRHYESRYVRVVVEQVGAMPGQGVTSSFHFGEGVGLVRGILAARGLPVVWVHPNAWKRHHGLLRTAKDASRQRAIQIFPALAGELKLKKHHGRADALLIADWLRHREETGE